MSSLFLALIAGIVGAILRWFLPALSDWLRTRKLAKNLLGEWNSTYQGIDEPEGTWIEEKIAIRVHS